MKTICKYIFAGLVVFTACQKTETKEKEVAKESIKSLPEETHRLKTDLTILNDSLHQNWQHMAESEEKKLASIKRLLDEISYTPKYNPIKHRQLMQMYANVNKFKLNLTNMKDSDLIDRYDAGQDTLVNKTLDLTAATPLAENYPLISELSQDIQAEHNNTLLFRIKHDNIAREINKMLEEKNGEISKLGQPFDTLTKIPVFSLSGS